MKTRRSCFFGIHNDFHATPERGIVVGAALAEADIREICETLKPDFIQIDCKGHPGWTSYPTELGNAIPEFRGDPLRLWRDVTKEYGIALYMHYSGVFDKKYCDDHPDERIISADGTPGDYIRFDGNYADNLLIPQISELAEKYEIDGVWIDGECWAVNPDYHPETIRAFEEQTGIKLNGDPPKKSGDEYFREYLDFTRERFRAYLRYYVDALHKKFPSLQICSNWAFSDLMPEEVCADVDFISGDLDPVNSVNSARYAGRMIASQNMPWDLMSWNFRYMMFGAPLMPPKHSVQILQEAASVIALGGAFQDYIPQFRDGSPNMEAIRALTPLADFMRDRKEYCFRGKFIHQAAMLVSTYDFRALMSAPFCREGSNELIAMTALLCDSGISLETLSEHRLRGHMSEYPLIVIPQLRYGLENDVVQELREYVLNGGSLLLIGIKTAEFFEKEGFPFKTSQLEKNPCYLRVLGGFPAQSTEALHIDTDGYAEVMGTAHSELRGGGVPFASVFGYGKGKLAVIGTDLASLYKDGAHYQYRDLVKRMTESMYDPMVKVESALGLLEVVCLEKDGRMMIQLVNANGHHSDPSVATEDFIPPTLDTELSIKAEGLKKITLRPENKVLAFELRDGRVYTHIDRIDIHSILELEY